VFVFSLSVVGLGFPGRRVHSVLLWKLHMNHGERDIWVWEWEGVDVRKGKVSGICT